MSNQYMPSMRTSDEANPKQLDMARAQGDTYIKALNHMANEVANDGSETRVDDYVVAYAVEAAEGMYHRVKGQLKWQEPDQENIHIEIAVRDGADNRFIPYLNVYVTLIDPDGNEVGTHQQPYLWHPWLYHYGRNWKVRQSGEYTLRVNIDAPDFARHDKENGQRFASDVKVVFEKVKINLEE